MFWKAGTRIALIVLVVLALLAAASFALGAVKRIGNEPDLVQRFPHVSGSYLGGRNTLDTDYNQLRYFKTTDFGATWGAMTIAGDLSTFNTDTTSFPDFGATVMNNNELCYSVYLRSAATPGWYAVPGPSFTPHLIMAKGTTGIDSVGNNGGFTDIGTSPNGALYATAWGHNAGRNTIWASKSTDNGVTWSTAVIVATEPALPAAPANLYAHISDMNSNTTCFVMFQDVAFGQFVMHFPNTPIAAGTIVNLHASTNTEFSYYIGGQKPIAYDPTASPAYVYCAFRGTSAGTGVNIYYSSDNGATFSGSQAVNHGERYPEIAMRPADGTPWVMSNEGAGADPHDSWITHDELGYGGGSWTTPLIVATVPNPGGAYGLLYCNQVYWWDANRGFGSHNLWGNVPAITPAGSYTTHTTDGGATWIDQQQRWFYVTASLEWGTCQQVAARGGTNGIGYVVFSGKVGDVIGPAMTDLTLVTPVAQLPPYLIKCSIIDNQATDSSSITLNFDCPRIKSDTLYSVLWDSIQHVGTDPHGGWYWFTITNPFPDDTTHLRAGDTIYWNVNGYDLKANFGETFTQYAIVGSVWAGADEHTLPTPAEFKLYANYPNPFNPSTRIYFDLPTDERVSVVVYNTLGQQVARLADNAMLPAGQHIITFDASDLPSGMYFYRVTAGQYAATQKMVLLK